MTDYLWVRFTTDGRLNDECTRHHPGALAALRRGTNQQPGAAPEMWPYYTQLNRDGHLTKRLIAEHTCLVTYGTHQQGVSYAVHQEKTTLGEALRRLRDAGTFSEQAVDRHVNELATASQPAELARHLLSLVKLMRATKQPIGFDYTRLVDDLTDLQQESTAPRVRRRWGSAYYRRDAASTATSKE